MRPVLNRLRGRRRGAVLDASGVTMIELMIALFLSVFVAIAAGVIFTANQRSFRQGEGKLTLQRNATQVVEQIARDVRAANRVQLVGGGEIRTFDQAGSETARYLIGSSGGINKVLRSGTPATPERATALAFSANADTTLIIISLELEDQAQNRVRVNTRSAVRNRDYSGI